MRGLAVLLLIVVILFSLSLVAVIISFSLADDGSKLEENPKTAEFSTFTSAVCENKEESVYCKDELFINCNGETSKVVNIAECSGIKLGLPKVSGSAAFSKDWKDPRA